MDKMAEGSDPPEKPSKTKKKIVKKIEINAKPAYLLSNTPILSVNPSYYETFTIMADGNYKLGDVVISKQDKQLFNPCKIMDINVLQNILTQFQILHYPIGNEDLSKFTDDIKIAIFSKIPVNAIPEVFNILYENPRNNNITIDSSRERALTIKKDKYMELIVVAVNLEKQLDDISYVFMSIYMRLVKNVKGLISELRYKQHLKLMNNFEISKEYDMVKSLYKDYLIQNSVIMSDIMKIHENIFHNLKKIASLPG
jgi:hypothetical protein